MSWIRLSIDDDVAKEAISDSVGHSYFACRDRFSGEFHLVT
jgi:hypothetical protein